MQLRAPIQQFVLARVAPFAVAVGLLLPGAAYAQKIGTVDMNRAMNEVDEGKIELSALEVWQKSKRDEVQAEEEGLLKRKEDLEKKAEAGNPESMKADMEQYLKDVENHQKKKMSLAQELQEKLGGATMKIKEKMDAIVAVIGQRESFDLIVDLTNGGVVYAPRAMDVTNELIRLYNEKYPVKNKPPAKAAAPAADPKKKPK